MFVKLTFVALVWTAKLTAVSVALVVKVTPWLIGTAIVLVAVSAALVAGVTYNSWKLVAAPIAGQPVRLYLMGHSRRGPDFHFHPVGPVIPIRRRPRAIAGAPTPWN